MALCARCGQHTESETDGCAACGGYTLGTRAYAASTAAAGGPPHQAPTGLRYEQSTNDPDPDEFWYEQHRQAGGGVFQWQRGPEPENGRQHFVPEQPHPGGAESVVASGADKSGEQPEFNSANSGWPSQPEPDAWSSGGSVLGSLPAVHTPFAATPSPSATAAGYEMPGAVSAAAGDRARYHDPANTAEPHRYEMPGDLLDQPDPAAVRPGGYDVPGSPAGESSFDAAAGSLGTLPSQAAPAQAAPAQAAPSQAVPAQAMPSHVADVSEPGLAASHASADEAELSKRPSTDWASANWPGANWPGTNWPGTDWAGTGESSTGWSGAGAKHGPLGYGLARRRHTEYRARWRGQSAALRTVAGRHG